MGGGLLNRTGCWSSRRLMRRVHRVGNHGLPSRPANANRSVRSACGPRRPEDFEDATLAESSVSERRLSAPVALIEALGSAIMVHVSIDAPNVDAGDPDVLDTAPTEGQANAVGRFSPRSRVRMGEVVEIAVTTENLHFFDPHIRLALVEGS